MDSGWRGSQNPNRDVAFLVVGRRGKPGVQLRTGGERLGTGWPARTWVHVIGYPDGARWPVICGSRAQPFGQHQLRFDCGGYPDGTSGGPFLARWRAAAGRAIRSLYRAAVAAARAAG